MNRLQGRARGFEDFQPRGVSGLQVVHLLYTSTKIVQ
jgi:hypothetical protein